MEQVLIDEQRPETLGLEAWQGVTWDYSENIRVPEPQTLTKTDDLSLETFMDEFTLLLEYFGKTKEGKPTLSQPLLQKLYQVLSSNLTETRFKAACEAVYFHDLYWAKLMHFLLNFHVDKNVLNSQAYQLFNGVRQPTTDLEKDLAKTVETLKFKQKSKPLDQQKLELETYMKKHGLDS